MPRQSERAPSPSADYIAFDFDDAPPQDEKRPAEVVDDSVREHASARSTPWARDIAWHECSNVAEMCVPTC